MKNCKLFLLKKRQVSLFIIASFTFAVICNGCKRGKEFSGSPDKSISVDSPLSNHRPSRQGRDHRQELDHCIFLIEKGDSQNIPAISASLDKVFSITNRATTIDILFGVNIEKDKHLYDRVFNTKVIIMFRSLSNLTVKLAKRQKSQQAYEVLNLLVKTTYNISRMEAPKSWRVSYSANQKVIVPAHEMLFQWRAVVSAGNVRLIYALDTISKFHRLPPTYQKLLSQATKINQMVREYAKMELEGWSESDKKSQKQSTLSSTSIFAKRLKDEVQKLKDMVPEQ